MFFEHPIMIEKRAVLNEQHLMGAEQNIYTLFGNHR